MAVKLIAEFHGGSYPVEWFYHDDGEHVVTYGDQRREFSDSVSASREFGESVRHSAECEGAFDHPDADS